MRMPETWWSWPLAVFRYYTCLRCSSGQNTSFGTNRCTSFFGHLCTVLRCKHNPWHTTFLATLEFLVQPWHMHSILADRFVSSLHFHSHPNSSHSCTGNTSSSALKWKLHYETKSALKIVREMVSVSFKLGKEIEKNLFRLECGTKKRFWVPMRYRTSDLWIPRSDALLPLQHVKNRESERNVDLKIYTF